MASIIRMTSTEFLKKFCKKYNYKRYNFIIVSENIKNNRTRKNVFSIPALMPPSKALTKWIDGKKADYLKAYYKYLATGEIEIYITTLVKLCVMEDSDVILLCSEEEDEYEYLDAICRYIEEIYGVPTYSFKKYDKSPKKCNSGDHKKKTVKVIKKKMDAYKKFNISPQPVKISKKEMKARLQSMDKSTLLKICKKNKIKCKDKSRSELVKAIIKEM